MKKLIIFLTILFNSFLFAQNFTPYKELNLGVKEDKLVKVLNQNNVKYEYWDTYNAYYITMPEDFDDTLPVKNIIARLNKKRKIYQIEMIFDSDYGTETFAKALKQMISNTGLKCQEDADKNKYHHNNSYCYWKKGFYVMEEFFNPGLCVGILDTRYAD